MLAQHWAGTGDGIERGAGSLNTTSHERGTDLELRPLPGGLGAELTGFDFGAPISDERFAAVHAAFLEWQVLVFSGNEVPPGGQVEFARRFGEVQIHVMNQYHADGHPELYRLSNLDADGNPSGRHPDHGTLEWHTDGSWQARTGLATMMYAVEIPARGGETHFCDMYGALERLSPETRARIEELRAVHNLDFSRSRRHGDEPMTDEQRLKVPPVAHPIVRTHPETGRDCLFLGDHAESIEGMDYSQGRALVDELNATAATLGTVYRHRWRPHQLVVWDNRCLMHRATAYDTAGERRVIRRCTVVGDAPFRRRPAGPRPTDVTHEPPSEPARSRP